MTLFLHRSDLGFIKVSATEFLYKGKIIRPEITDKLPLDVIPLVWAVPLAFQDEWKGYSTDHPDSDGIYMAVEDMAGVYAGMHRCKYTPVRARDAESHLRHIKWEQRNTTFSDEGGRCFEVAVRASTISGIGDAVTRMWRYRDLVGKFIKNGCDFYYHNEELDSLVLVVGEKEIMLKKLELLDWLEDYLSTPISEALAA